MGVDDHGSIDVDGVTYVDCGCWFTDRDDVFYIQPCDGACEVYLNIAVLMAWMMPWELRTTPLVLWERAPEGQRHG